MTPKPERGVPVHRWMGPGLAVARLDALSALFEKAEYRLTEAEAAISDALVGGTRRASFFAGRILAKQCVLTVLADARIRHRDIEIGRDREGRPSVRLPLEMKDDIHVSISHGGAYVFAGACRDHPPGVDVEPVSKKPARLKASFLSDAEDRLIRSTSKEGTDVCYTAVFSAKESLAKRLGSHLYHAFFAYRLAALEQGTLAFEISDCRDVMRVLWRRDDGHILTWVA